MDWEAGSDNGGHMNMAEGIKDWVKGERGSFTLEASAVFPILAALVILFMLSGIYMYQKAIVYYVASAASERAAFSWDNSKRDPDSGILAQPEYDSLYWRLKDNRMLASLFGSYSGEEVGVVMTMPMAEELREDEGRQRLPLPERKLAASGERVMRAGAGYEGELSYSRTLLMQSVTTKLKQPLSLSSAFRSPGLKEPAAMSSAAIVDPVEFIRNVDLLRYYTAKLKGDDGTDKSNAGKVLETYSSDE